MILQLTIAVFIGVLLRDLQVWCAAKVFCWHKRRQTQRRAATEKQERDRAAAEKDDGGCARLMAAVEKEDRLKRIQEGVAKRATHKLNSIPFMVEPETFQVGILCSREIVLHLQAQDQQRFIVLEKEGGQAN